MAESITYLLYELILLRIMNNGLTEDSVHECAYLVGDLQCYCSCIFVVVVVVVWMLHKSNIVYLFEICLSIV